MVEDEATEEQSTSETESTETKDAESQPEVVLDADAIEEQEQTVEDLVDTVEEQQDRIEELDGTVGKATPGTEVRIVEPDGDPDEQLPAGEVGELIVRTNDHPVWAWNRTAKNEAAFTDGWWHSGDVGYKDEDGYLYLEGRKDFMIMSKGIKVPPGPVEERLDEHPKVDESAVVGQPDDEYGEKVTAVVSAADPSVTAEELEEWCLDDDSLARYERPREYHILADPLPKTVTGKLDRSTTIEQVVDVDE